MGTEEQTTCSNGGGPQGVGSGSATAPPDDQPCACGADPGGKPFLGGYRNLHTGSLHHHACTQTPAPAPASASALPPGGGLVCSAAQTAEGRCRAAQTTADAATQCPRPGWYEDTSNDRVLLPAAKHETAAQLVRRRTAAAVVIQRHARGWLARRRAAEVRAAKADLEAFAAAQAALRARAAEEHRQAEVRRRMQPRSAADFGVLYSELGAWWGQEAARIKGAEAEEGAKREALRALLAKETRLLQTIDKLKIAATGPNRADRVEGALRRMAAPKQWSLPNGRLMEVQTPDTLRAAELAGVYRALAAADGSSADARLAALMQAQAAVRGFDGPAARELVQLVEREADLLNRGRSPEGMEGLRQRLANCFLELLRTPEFNPGAAALAPGGAAKPLGARQAYKFTRRNEEYWKSCGGGPGQQQQQQQQQRESAGVQTAAARE